MGSPSRSKGEKSEADVRRGHTGNTDSNEKGKEKGTVAYDVISHLKSIPAWLSVYDALKLSEDSRRSLVKALTDESVRQVLMVELEKTNKEIACQ